MPRWKDKKGVSDPNSAIYKAYTYFVNKGLTPAQSAGIVGNLAQESTIKLSTTREGFDGSGSVGIAQWLGERKDDLIIYAKSKGTQFSDFDTQLDYIWHEFHTTHRKAYNKLLKTATPTQAAQVISEHYEKPNKHYAYNNTRENYANQFYTEFTGQPATIPVSSELQGMGQINNISEPKLPRKVNVDFSFLNNVDNGLPNDNSTQEVGLKQFMGEMANLVSTQNKEQQLQTEEIKNNKYKSAIQEKINQRNFLSELISQSGIEIVEKV